MPHFRNKNLFSKSIGITLFSFILLATGFAFRTKTKVADPEKALQSKANIVIIFLDDSGFADFQPFGTPEYPTPNVMKLAQEGRRFNNFHVPQGICSASRAALMTGSYPGAVKVFGAHGPKQRGLETKWATMGEVLKRAGYSTGIFGKWHLGDQPETRPHNRGFDESAGLMYSNDMWLYHPENPEYWGQWPLQYWKNGQVTIDTVKKEHQRNLTKWYTQDAVDFIKRNKEKPFFLYLSHSMPHVPLFVSDEFRGESRAGLYGDVIMELDWSVGQINKTLKENGLEENTFILFTSDNGPWTSYGNHAGTTPYREAKATGFEGGTRSATIMKYPGHIAPGTASDQMLSSIDILPTVCALTGADLPENPIQGKNVWDLIIGKDGAVNPHEYYGFSTGNTFEGVYSPDGKWKLHLPHKYRTLLAPGNDGDAGHFEQKEISTALFNMELDPYEATNVIDQYPHVAEGLLKFAEQHKKKYFEN